MRPRLNRAQRVVVVIGWGLFLFFASNYVLVAGWHRPDGWFNYAPNNHSVYSPSGGAFQYLDGYGFAVDTRAVLVIRLIAVALWVGGALWLLREAPAAKGDQDEVDP